MNTKITLPTEHGTFHAYTLSYEQLKELQALVLNKETRSIGQYHFSMSNDRLIEFKNSSLTGPSYAIKLTKNELLNTIRTELNRIMTSC